MYLTDFREQALVDVIKSLDPLLFERVTGLTITDFNMLSKIGVFNPQHLDYAIYQFRQFENASLRYAEEAPDEPIKRRIGLWDTSMEDVELATLTGS